MSSNTNVEIKSKVIEPKNPDYIKVIEAQEYKKGGGGICCGHDFWDKNVGYGDVVLCTCCHQYFTKIKHLPWIVKRSTPHFYHIEIDCYIPVEVRITD